CTSCLCRLAGAGEACECSSGGVLGFVEQAKATGNIPQEQLDGLVSIAKNAFVDGLTAAAIVGPFVFPLAAVAVKRYLPNDHNTAQPETSPDVATPVASD